MVAIAETQIPQTDPNSNPNEQAEHDIWIETHAARYLSDSVCIPTALEQHGIELEGTFINPSLYGEGREMDNGTSGLGSAFIGISHFVNRTSEPIEAFNPDRLQRNTETHKVSDYSYTVDVLQFPPEEALREASSEHLVGEAGALFVRMLADIAYPYKAEPGDGYVELEARDPENAYKVGRHSSLTDNEVAKFCSETELHFANDLTSMSFSKRPKDIVVDGQVVAIQKASGSHTALLVKPVVLNGVRLPVGSAMTVEGGKDEGYKFGFGRPTMFTFGTLEYARRQFPKIYEVEFPGFMGYGNIDRAMESFNKLVGREVMNSWQLLNDYYARHKDEASTFTFADACKAVSEEIDDMLHDDEQARHISQGAHTLKKLSLEAAEAAYIDKEHFGASPYNNDGKTRVPIIRRIADLRSRMYRTYGPELVRTVEDLIEIKAMLERKAATSQP